MGDTAMFSVLLSATLEFLFRALNSLVWMLHTVVKNSQDTRGLQGNFKVIAWFSFNYIFSWSSNEASWNALWLLNQKYTFIITYWSFNFWALGPAPTLWGRRGVTNQETPESDANMGLEIQKHSTKMLKKPTLYKFLLKIHIHFAKKKIINKKPTT